MSNRADNFNRTGSVALGGSNPSDGGSAWNDPGGQWKTASDGGSGEVVAFDGNGSGDGIAWLDCGVTDHQNETELIRIDVAGGAAARVADTDHFYFFRAKADGTTELWKKVVGFSLLATGSLNFTPGVGNKLSVKCVGTTISGWVGTSQACSVTDSALSSGMGVGIWSGNGNAFTFVNSLAATDLSGGGSTDTPLNAQPGALTLTGFAAGFATGVAASLGSLTLTGSPASFGLALNAEPGTLTLTGFPADLLAGGNATLDAQPGSLALAGSAANFTSGLAASPGGLTVSGRTVAFAVTMTASPAALTLAGFPAALVATGDEPILGRVICLPAADRSVTTLPGIDRSVTTLPVDLDC